MKRSRKLRLSLMGVAPLALTACGSRSPENLVYERLSDCHADRRVSQIACNDAYNRALSEHARTARKFTSMDACQAVYGAGNCDVRIDAAGLPFYAPRMGAFMVGRYIPPASTWYGRSYSPSTVVTAGDWNPRPLYRTSSNSESGSWSTGDGKDWGGSKQATKISTSSLGRGGFGGTSSARSSWGG